MKRLTALLALVLALAAGTDARSTSLSDLYYTPGEDGWGANVIQQNNILFITIFVYGTNSQPTWLVGPAVVEQSTGIYSGTLYQTTGPWFGSGTFSPANVSNRPVGTVTFTASTLGTSTLSYSVDGTNVTKQVQRQTWAAVPAAGTYYGTLTKLTISSCNPTSSPVTGYGRFIVTTTGSGSGTLTFSFAPYQASTGTFPQSCTITGPYTQYGSTITQTADTAFPSCYVGSGRGQVVFDVQTQGLVNGISGLFALGNSGGTCADTYSIFASKG